VLLAVAIAAVGVLATTSPASSAVQIQFAEWRAKYNKNYATQAEFDHRLSAFVETIERVAMLNARNSTAHFAVGKFADLTKAEFKAKYLNLKPASLRDLPIQPVAPVISNDPTPTSFDWKDKEGTMTYVKDQGQCGSCWAFSIVESIESVWKLAGNPLVELSPQQVVSCDLVDQGCDGGDPQTAFQYVTMAGGLNTEKDYPYYSGDSGWADKCTAVPEKFVAKTSGFGYAVPSCNDTCKNQGQYEQQVRDVLYNVGPLSICVDASDWQDYSWGIFMGFCSQAADQQDHAVLLTGFDVKGGFYNVRNSWASDWGEDGFIRLGLGDNTCGMLDLATYPIIKK